MREDFGLISEIDTGQDCESLVLSFWPGRVSLKQRWRNNGLSADFLGDYVTTFYPLEDDSPRAHQRRSEIRGAVSYVANELLENAMKFHDTAIAEPITIRLGLERERIIFHESNAINRAVADTFRAFILRLRAADPGELYLAQLEDNALTDSSAGLGYLTMINDYDAELAWRFEPLPGGGTRVTTQVAIKL